jgi:hypothetical protein
MYVKVLRIQSIRSFMVQLSRECFKHLMKDFRNKYQGDVLKYMWPCAWSCTAQRHQKLQGVVQKQSLTCKHSIAKFGQESSSQGSARLTMSITTYQNASKIGYRAIEDLRASTIGLRTTKICQRMTTWIKSRQGSWRR